MSLHQAVLRAKEAAAHAKPLMKLMDALSDLDGELRAAGQLETDAQAAIDKKTKLEGDIPALQKQKSELASERSSLQMEIDNKRAACDTELAQREKNADQKLFTRHAQIEAEHQAKITALKNEISTLGGTISALEKQKSDIESQIGALRKTFEDAHAALHA